MDRHEKSKQLQSAGICHRLFCFIMKALAAQALKPVTLGPTVPRRETQESSYPRIDRQYRFPLTPRDVGSTERAEDSESLASVDIEYETSALLVAKEDGWWHDERKVIVQTTVESGATAKAPRKMVSIKDEPEIIYYVSKKRRKNEAERQSLEGRETRPLRSILKVGSNLCESVRRTAPVGCEKPTRNDMMYY